MHGCNAYFWLIMNFIRFAVRCILYLSRLVPSSIAFVLLGNGIGLSRSDSPLFAVISLFQLEPSNSQIIVYHMKPSLFRFSFGRFSSTSMIRPTVPMSSHQRELHFHDGFKSHLHGGCLTLLVQRSIFASTPARRPLVLFGNRTALTTIEGDKVKGIVVDFEFETFIETAIAKDFICRTSSTLR